ncbi:hypothetical protein AB0F17_65800 [Nonomuraea sp. NPDC026600]|uniref:hypothetical protein n=1 Tax=Nonomuraea sp. NPDC026600 TaxID=3155363 RepID=UPI0033EFDB03
MPDPNVLLTWSEAHPALAITAGGVLLLLVVSVLVACVRLVRKIKRADRVEDALTYLAAGLATGGSATGMWRFAGDVLGLDGPLRVLLFGVVEVAVITSAVRARKAVRTSAAKIEEEGTGSYKKPSAGIDGTAVWALTLLTAVCSAMDAKSGPEVVFRLALPLVAAWLWERGMAIERDQIITRRPGRIAWKISPERLLVKWGLADPTTRDASEVAVHRYVTKLALAANKVRELEATGAKPEKQARALARLHRARDAAVEYAGLGTESATLDMLMGQLRVIYNTPEMARLTLTPPWEMLDTVDGFEVEQVRPAPEPDPTPDPNGGGHPNPELPTSVTTGTALPGAVIVPSPMPLRVNGAHPDPAPTGQIDPPDPGDPFSAGHDPDPAPPAVDHLPVPAVATMVQELPSVAAKVRTAIAALGNDPFKVSVADVMEWLDKHGVTVTKEQVKTNLTRARVRAKDDAEVIHLLPGSSRDATRGDR